MPIAPLRFFDCNTFIGTPQHALPGGGVKAAGLVQALDRAEIARALVWHIAQLDGHPLEGNALLEREIAPYRDRLVPCWSALPPQTGELGDIDEWFAGAAAAGVKALRLWPRAGRFLMRREAVGEVLERMAARGWPLIYSLARGGEWPELYDLAAEFPRLPIIVGDVGCWGPDRFFRPLLDKFPNICLEISDYFVPGGLEAFVERYGPQRLLFGTAFPAQHHGGMMLMLAHAEVSDEAKQMIAAGNLERLLGEAPR
jgi:predicted TIM-barrel fold metal-dependent hydrolase